MSDTHTIANLALAIEKAEREGSEFLLPEGVDPTTYPLPSDMTELLRVAELKMAAGARPRESAYIKRCRKRYKDRLARTAGIGVRRKAMRIGVAVTEAKQKIAEKTREVDALVDEAKATVIRLYTSMNEVFELSKDVQKDVMEAWKLNRPIHGEIPTITQALRAAKDVQTSVKALGGASVDDEKESEKAVFDEFERTKERVALIQRPLKGPEEPQ